MTTLALGDIIEGEIETIAFGGEGILRHNGFVIFIPFTAIGDRISCKIKEVKRSFAKGICIAILKPSPSRITPRCPYFQTCGGCQLQHLDDQAKKKYQIEAVSDALERIGGLELPPIKWVSAESPWAYRRHITLHLKPQENGFIAGYIGEDKQSLIQVKTCPIFNEKNDNILEEVNDILKGLNNSLKIEGRLTLLKSDLNQIVLSFNFDHPFQIDQKEFQNILKKNRRIKGVLVRTPKKMLKIGEFHCIEKINGIDFHFSPETFIQNNAEQSANIYKEIRKWGSESQTSTVFDLYCGFGITSLILAQENHLVIGMEINQQAINFANHNAQINGFSSGKVRFIQGDVEKLLPVELKKNQPSLVLINPPRAGVSKKVIETLLHSQLKEIIYISCMPSTLARDLSIFNKNGYQAESSIIYDMFPQTAHIETLTHLKKL